MPMYRAASVASSPGTERVLMSGTALGTQDPGQTDFTYYAVPAVAQRGVVSRFVVTSSDVGLYDVVVAAIDDDTGEHFLSVVGQLGTYDISSPFYFENDTDDTMYVGVKNTGGVTQTFTLTTLRVERLA